jgi:oxaloacetate decarboxylase (Na+ extruding) subunit alpha
MTDVHFIDTTLRDGQQSLWALNMRAEVMTPIVGLLDSANFDAMEFWMPWIQIGKVARDLRENPWDWPRYGAPLARKTRLRLHGSPRNAISRGFDTVPKEVTRLLVRKCVDYGIRYTRLSSPWNDAAEIEPQIRELERDGVECVANLIYSVSPRHTDEYYEERAAAMAALRPYRICFKDVGGLLTPERAKVLIPKILRQTGDIDVEYHAHCNNGLATLCYLDAADAGIRFLHTAIPPLADGSSNPSLFEVATNLTERGHTPVLDQTGLAKVSKHLEFVARRDGLPVGARPPHDERLLKHQVPGGMISNLRHQLEKVGQAARMPEVLEETGRVRADFGYPIMVTPLSQFVGVQASMNVITGQRYSVVSDEVIQYALGLWGQEAPAVMDSQVRDLILDRPRTEELRRPKPPAESLAQVRARFGAGISDEELILRVYAADDADKLEHRGKPDDVLLGESPLVDLVSGLAAAKNYRQIVVRKGAAHVGVSRG